jgi:hypothetical protein
MIISLQGNTGDLSVFAGANATSAGNLIIAKVSSATASGYGATVPDKTVFFEFPSEGMALPIGVTPKAAATNAGSYVITGTGRIVQDGPITNQRPSWKESLTGAGLPPGGGTNTTAQGNVLPATGHRAMEPDGLPDGSQNPTIKP